MFTINLWHRPAYAWRWPEVQIMLSTQQLYDELLEGYLLQTREQIQQDLLTFIDSDDQELNVKMCQIVVDNFDKFLL